MEFFEILSKNQKNFKTPYSIGSILSDHQAMEAALFEGYKGLGLVSPNPLVGCSILNKERHLLSLGYHRAYGKEHAEIHAIKKLIPSFSTSEIRPLAQFQHSSSKSKKKEAKKILEKFSVLKNAHLFVTLEPCAFKGHQESCAKILSSLPFQSITYGILDPHQKVSGKGIQILKSSSKDIKSIQNLKLIQKIKELTEVFSHNIKHKRAFVALKIATSLDGKIALKNLADLKEKKRNLFFNSTLRKEKIQVQKLSKNIRSSWITNSKARKYSHFLRGSFDATLIGINTLLIDNPRLDIRHELFPNKKNNVVIMDPNGKSLKMLQNLNISSFHKPKNIFIAIHKEQISSQRNTKYNLIGCPSIKGTSLNRPFSLDLDFLNKELFKRSIHSIYVEGGAGVHSSYLEQSQWNRIYQFLAPSLFGDLSSLSWTKNFGIKNIRQSVKIKNTKVTFFEDNLLISGTS